MDVGGYNCKATCCKNIAEGYIGPPFITVADACQENITGLSDIILRLHNWQIGKRF